GLAAAVYGGSEGLSVLVLDCRAFGGQAGASARIENYLGVPTGITGMALMARAYNQAQKFGVEMAIPDEVIGLDHADDLDMGGFVLKLCNGERVRARCVVIASGARYGRPRVSNCSRMRACTIGHRRLKQNYARDRKWLWWEPAIRRGKQQFIYRARSLRCGCWCAGQTPPPGCWAFPSPAVLG